MAHTITYNKVVFVTVITKFVHHLDNHSNEITFVGRKLPENVQTTFNETLGKNVL